MKKEKHLAFLGLLTILSGMLVMISCGNGGATPSSRKNWVEITPTPTYGPGPSLQGTLMVKSGYNLHFIRRAANSKSPTIQSISRVLSEFLSLSPNGKYLLYNGDDSLVLYNVKEGSGENVVNENVACVSWAQDSTRFTYVSYGRSDTNLSVYSLASHESSLVDTPPSAEYSLNGVGPGQRWFGGIDCGTWVGPERLIFQRYVGDMPATVGSGEATANTTSLARLDGSREISDYDRRFIVHSVSDDGSQFLLEFFDPDILHPAVQTFAVSKAFEDLGDSSPREIPCNGRFYRIGFIPGTNQIYCDSQLRYEDRHVLIIDTERFSSVEGPLIRQNWEPEWVWVGDAKDQLIGVVQFELNPPRATLSLIDPIKNGKTEISDVMMGTKVLGWIPD